MKLFLNFTKMAFHRQAAYRLMFWLIILSTFISLYGAYWLWNTLYARQPNAFGVSLEQMLTYAMLGMVLNPVFSTTSWARGYISTQMRTGAIQMDLLRPLDFPLHLLARCTGQMLFTLMTPALPAFLLGVLFLGLRPPASLTSGLLFLLSMILAYLVSFSISFLVGMITIYTTGARNIGWFYYSVIAFLSGQMVPLWIFPPLLARVVSLLPFQAIFGIPLSIYIGRLSPAEAGQSLALQTFWAAALLGLGRLVWRNAHTHLCVQGG